MKKNHHIFFLVLISFLFLGNVLNQENGLEPKDVELKTNIKISEGELFDLLNGDNKVVIYDDTFQTSDSPKRSQSDVQENVNNPEKHEEKDDDSNSILNYTQKYFPLEMTPLTSITKESLKDYIYSNDTVLEYNIAKNFWLYNNDQRDLLIGIVDIPEMLKQKFQTIHNIFQSLKEDLKKEKPAVILERMKKVIEFFMINKNENNEDNLHSADNILNKINFNENQKDIEKMKFNEEKKNKK
jgi:hypothetical protein